MTPSKLSDIQLTGCLYLAESYRRKVIKVGISTQPLSRLVAIEHESNAAGGPKRFRMIGFAVGRLEDESAILRIASEVATPIRGKEWFLWSGELMERLKPLFPMELDDAMRMMNAARTLDLKRREESGLPKPEDTVVRVDTDLHRRVKKFAASIGVSMKSVLEYAVVKHYDLDPKLFPDDAEKIAAA